MEEEHVMGEPQSFLYHCCKCVCMSHIWWPYQLHWWSGNKTAISCKKGSQTAGPILKVV